MLESLQNEELEYAKLSPEEMKSRGILGRLTGPCADIVNPTRNGRKYSEELWDKVFSSPLVQEQFNAGGIFGELTHPDREDVDIEKIAIVMPAPPKKNNKGLLIGEWDILDTPCGRILKTLCDYGYKVGISTRGSGDLYTDYDGQESVDPDSYTLNALDIVTIPAVKAARLDYLTESLGGKTLKQSLQESINNATDKDKVLMKEALTDLDINLEENETTVNDQETGLNIDEDEDNDSAVDNNEANIVSQLQEALKKNIELQDTVTNLQEQLLVCHTKNDRNSSKLDIYRKNIHKLSEQLKKVDILESKNKILQEQLDKTNSELEVKTNEIQSLQEKLNASITIHNSIKESLDSKNDAIKTLRKKIITQRDSYDTKLEDCENKVKSLTEELENLRNDYSLKESKLSKGIESANASVKKYKKIAESAVNRYIDSQAKILGVTPEEIKNRLPESYTFDNINQICENLREYKISMSKLPFSSNSLNENIKSMKIVSAKKDSIIPEIHSNDEIDEQLLYLTNLD